MAFVAREVLLGRRSESPLSSLTAPAREGGAAMKTTREKAEEKRQAKLELIDEQVRSGTLVIRPMTAEERRRYAPRSAPPKRSGRG